MSNWVKNIVRYEGDEDAINQMLMEIQDDSLGAGTIDFDKIIPMPDHIYRGNLGEVERKLYGANNWYNWCMRNWGTKWNACHQEPHDVTRDPSVMEFDTAWTAPFPIYEVLSRKYSNIRFYITWADEDIGVNCGEVTFYDGEVEEEYISDDEGEARRFAMDVWGMD